MAERRIEFLDSLRGLAALAVVLSHFVLAYRLDIEYKPVFYSPLHFFFDGFAAVTVFFVLSGYVLTLSLRRQEQILLGDFYARRIFRIMPAYIVALFLSLLCFSFYKNLQTTPDDSTWLTSFWTKPQDVNSFIRQIFFLRTENHAELIFQNWTLAEEMRFSFIIPFLYFIFKKSSFTFFLICNIILIFCFSGSVFTFHFSAGIWLAMNQEKILEVFNKVKKKYKICLFIVTVLLYTYRYTIPMYYYYYYRKLNFLNNDDMIWFINGVGAFLVLLYCFSSKKLEDILNHSIFRFVGKLSYAIYLLHMLILIFFTPLFISLLNNYGLTNRYAIWPLSLIFLLALTTIMAYLLNRFVETPMVKWGGALIKKCHKHKHSKQQFKTMA